MAEAVVDNVPAKTDGKPPLFGLSFLENLSEMTMLRQVGLMVGLARQFVLAGLLNCLSLTLLGGNALLLGALLGSQAACFGLCSCCAGLFGLQLQLQALAFGG